MSFIKDKRKQKIYTFLNKKETNRITEKLKVINGYNGTHEGKV